MKTIYKKLLFLFLLLPLSVLAQNTLSGVVLDKSSGQPMPGVNITVLGTTNGVATDFDGKFQLKKIVKGDKIVFSFIGFKSETVVYSNQTTINVSLQDDANLLSEVVIQVGYGTVKKKDATGSLTTVTSKDFNKGSIISADQLLTGKAAGVRITTNGGQPDASPNIRIRGGASLSANNSPLIVIDGVPVDNTTPAGVGNPFSLINPNDIESFTVLKDASATAIYGSRASNGVVIITTKKGAKGAMKFTFSTTVMTGKVGKKINVMDGATFTRFIQENHPTYTNLLGIDDPNSTLSDDLATPEVEGRLLSNTDWQDQIFRTSFSVDNNFSASGSIFKTIPFRSSIGYLSSQGIVKDNDYNRFSYALKLSPTLLNDKLKIDFNAKTIFTNKSSIDEGGALGGAVNMDPTKPVYDNSATNRFGGYYQSTRVDGNRLILDGAWNPLAVLKQRSRPEKAFRFLGNVELDYKLDFVPGLRAVVNMGLDASRAKISEVYDDNSLATYRFNSANTDINTNYVFNPGENYLENQTMTNTTWDSYLTYAKKLKGFMTKFDVQAGYSYQNFKNDGNKVLYQYNNDSGLRELVVNTQNPTNRYFNTLNLQSFFGRTNIDFANKYLVTLSLRSDGSSLFNKDSRWGYFPAAALAWKVKEEKFLKEIALVNDLKVRLGYGKTGQQDITGNVGFYPSTPLFAVGSTTSQYLDNSNLYSALAYNPDLTWEKTTSYNLGIDFDFFKNSFVTGSFDIYKRETNDLLARVPLPPGQGLSDTFVKNVGSTSSKGFELGLNFNPITTDKMSLSINSNLAYNRSEVTSLKDVSAIQATESGLPTGTGVILGYHAVGFQPYSAWVFQQLYNEAGEPIVGAFVDRNGDNAITNDDRYYKAMRPNWTFGFGFNFNYGNWDISSAFRGQIGGQVYNTRILTSGWVDKALPSNSNSLSNVLNFYDSASDFDFQNMNGNTTFSDYFLEDATFLRCENIVVGYKFNKIYKGSSLRVYGALNNPFILTKYSGQDPENFNAIDNNFYPRPKMVTLGLSLDF
jgi:iron complex outermembrane receptor protein